MTLNVPIYNLRKLLGQGGFGDVYLGRHDSLNTYAAVKVLQSEKRMTEEEKALFQREARTLVKLAHAHIVKVQDYGVENDVPFLVMDYYRDGSIRKLHPTGTRLPPATVLSYVKQIAMALQHAHNKKHFHRDVKPDNILVDKQSTSAGPNPHILLTDFGLSIVAHIVHVSWKSKKYTIIRTHFHIWPLSIWQVKQSLPVISIRLPSLPTSGFVARAHL